MTLKGIVMISILVQLAMVLEQETITLSVCKSVVSIQRDEVELTLTYLLGKLVQILDFLILGLGGFSVTITSLTLKLHLH